jgi:hypothetical protein
MGAARTIVRLGAPLLLVGLALPLIRAQVFSTNDAFDEVNYHRPIIATMAAELPAVDIVNYNAAMAPGYHVAMASVLRISGSWTVVRTVNLAVGVLLVMLAGQVAWRLSNNWSAALTTLPLAASSYVVSGSVWLTTDNLGLLLAMGSLSLLILDGPRAARSLASGGMGALAALVRQIHIWTAIPIAVSAFAGAALPPSHEASAGHRSLREGGQPRRLQPRRPTLALIAPPALPMLAIGSLVLLWGGLLPPRFVGHHGGWNSTTFVFGLALIGIYGLPWILLARSDAGRTVRSRAGAIALVLAAAASVAPSSYDAEAGRWGGWLWEAVRRTPSVLDRSVLLTLLAVAGAVTLATLSRRAVDRGRTRETCMLMVALASWMVAQSANFQVWQRYFEPAILMVLSWLIALAPPPLDSGRWALPLAMTGWVLAATLLLVHGDVYGFISGR